MPSRTCESGEMAAMLSGDGRLEHEDLWLWSELNREAGAEGRMPFNRSGSPLPSLKVERTSSERGSPGRIHPRWLQSVLMEFTE